MGCGPSKERALGFALKYFSKTLTSVLCSFGWALAFHAIECVLGVFLDGENATALHWTLRVFGKKPPLEAPGAKTRGGIFLGGARVLWRRQALQPFGWMMRALDPTKHICRLGWLYGPKKGKLLLFCGRQDKKAAHPWGPSCNSPPWWALKGATPSACINKSIFVIGMLVGGALPSTNKPPKRRPPPLSRHHCFQKNTEDFKRSSPNTFNPRR